MPTLKTPPHGALRAFLFQKNGGNDAFRSIVSTGSFLVVGQVVGQTLRIRPLGIELALHYPKHKMDSAFRFNGWIFHYLSSCCKKFKNGICIGPAGLEPVIWATRGRAYASNSMGALRESICLTISSGNVSLYYRVVVIRVPIQGLCYTVKDAVDWLHPPTTRWFTKGSNHSPLQFC